MHNGVYIYFATFYQNIIIIIPRDGNNDKLPMISDC